MGNALILVGHGSTKTERSAAATLELAERLRGRGVFDRVSPAFFLHDPTVDAVLAEQTDDTVFLVPVLTSDGYFSNRVLPERCGLTGTITRQKNRVVHLCDPLGTHPRIPDLVAAQAGRILAASGARPDQAELLVVGHGTDRDTGSARRTAEIRHHAATVLGIEARFALLESAPRLSDWRPNSDKSVLIVLPFLMAHGLHSGYDIPKALGLEPEHPDLVALNGGKAFAGPFRSLHREIWFARPIGLDDAMPDLVIDRTRQAALIHPDK